MGVHTLSADAPIKSAGFGRCDAAFEGTGKYADWIFSYVSPVAAQQAVRP
jgi:hypothetical protein